MSNQQTDEQSGKCRNLVELLQLIRQTLADNADQNQMLKEEAKKAFPESLQEYVEKCHNLNIDNCLDMAEILDQCISLARLQHKTLDRAVTSLECHEREIRELREQDDGE